MSTFFEHVKVPQVLMGVELIDKGLVNKTYIDLCNDIKKVVLSMYYHITPERVLPAKTFGTYFPPLFENPNKFIIPQPELIPVLKKLKDQGKFLFIATNSHYEYTELIMEATLGPKWRESFDFVFSSCRKPLFFTAKNPMYICDTSNPHFKGRKLETFLDLVPDSSITYLEGNHTFLEGFLSHHFNKKVPEIAFFGDQYTSDVSFSHSLPGWSGIAIIEEMSLREEEYKVIEQALPFAPMDLQLVKYDKYWSEDYF